MSRAFVAGWPDLMSPSSHSFRCCFSGSVVAKQVLFCTALAILLSAGSSRCSNVATCTFSQGDATYDLTPLVHVTGDTDWEFDDGGDQIIYWNYCANTVQMYPCNQNFPCWYTLTGTDCFTFGTLTSLNWAMIDPLDPAVGVSMKFHTQRMCDNVYYGVSVDNYCDPDQTDGLNAASVHTSDDGCTVHVDVYTIYGCPVGMLTSEPSGLSVGSWMLIFLLIAVVLYLAGFIGFNYYKGKRGFELAPHRDFWMSLPFLVKDGIIFAFSETKQLYLRCRGGQSPAQGDYSQL